MLQEWSITRDHLSSITTDNASNMKKAFQGLPCVWLSCFGHNLNLAIVKVLKLQRVESAVRACRHLVQGFSRSWRRKRELKKNQGLLNIPEKSLIHDVVTRWGSTFKMIERFLEQQQACCAVLAADRSSWHLMPKDSDVRTLEMVCQLLGPLNDFTDLLASETKTTLSSLKPVMEHITGILEEKEEDDALTKQMKKVMMDDLQQRYSSEDVSKLIDIACFIDPRFKGNFSQNKDETVMFTVEEAVKLEEITSRPPQELLAFTTAQEQGNSTSTTTVPSAATKKKDKSLSCLLKKITSAKQETVKEGDVPLKKRVIAEVKLYMSQPPISSDTDPLAWWKIHAQELPLLGKVARKFLCIPATSVPSETVFSCSGHILVPHRSKLNPGKVNMLTFLQLNLD